MRRLRRKLSFMKSHKINLGQGIGWRAELAHTISRRAGLGFVEILAEDISPEAIPAPVYQLCESGVAVVPHGVTLSLGGAERPGSRRLERLARLAKKLDSPFVSEHIAFVRAGGVESGHLLPLPRTRDALDVLVENVREAQSALPVPLALENIATLFEWPGAEMEEWEFITEALDRTGALLLLDISNLYANARNHGWDAVSYLDRIPLERIAYVHVAGGVMRDGLYHDTHAHATPAGPLDLLAELSSRIALPGVMLERDDHFPDEAELNRELDAIAESCERGANREAVIYG
jgi:uncharacterized protein (UPF0276 family)